MQYEVVIYKYGTNLYHQVSDNAMLRPNVEELARHPFQKETEKKSKYIYYIYTADDSLSTPISPVFTSNSKCDEWRRMQGLKYGDVYLQTAVNDEYWTGHR